MIGTTIGQYRIESEAGAGGMGVVYRAVDVDLKRPVAIKVLNAAAVGDPDRRRRFVQEAQAASALNHPDIVTIYQIGTDGGTDFIAMELVAGRSLDQVLRARRMPLTDVVKFAIRIAGALAAAHRAGIVHRDLKPANVMVTDKGDLKLLDFGIAKLVGPSTDETEMTGAIGAQTRTGLVVGTLAYMSPEQACGEKVDARSDIYAFGVVLHEMIAGKRPGDGVSAALKEAPRDLRRIVAQCLQDDPDRRFQVMDDVKLALEGAELVDGTSDRAASPGRRSWRRVTVQGAVVAMAVTAAAAVAWRLKPVSPAPTPILTRLTMDSGLTIDPVLSPDGRFIAFASDRSGDGNLDIWVRQVAGGEPVRLTRDPADDVEPSFSPDGSRIAFRSDREGGGVYVVSTLGGDERRIADQCRGPRWSPDGLSIACWTGVDTAYLMSKADALRVYVVAATGGEPRRLFADFAVAFAPLWSADGTHLLFLGKQDSTGAPDWFVADANGGSVVRTGAHHRIQDAGLEPSFAGFFMPGAWAAGGDVLFSARRGDSTNIWRIAIPAGGHAGSPPQRVTAGTGLELHPTMAANGAIAFAAITNDIDLWGLPTDTSTGKPTGPMQRLTQDPATDAYPALSPDGEKLVFASNRSGTYDIWVQDRPTGKDSVLAANVTFPSLPFITKDGLSVVFQSLTAGRWLSVPLRGRGLAAPEVVCDGCEALWDVSADGKWAVYDNSDSSLGARALATGRATEILRAPGDVIGRLRISPDDRWVVFNYRAGGSIRLHVAPFQTGSAIPRDRWTPITGADTTVNAGTWSPDGGIIYYLSNQDGKACIWAQRIDRQSGRPAGDAFAVWHFHDARRSLAAVPLPVRGLTLSRDRLVVNLSDGTGNIWLAR
jgi:Tol biopolymer transport system component/predicted Ser/Thr protein kinase